MTNECGYCDHEKVCIYKNDFIDLKKETDKLSNSKEIFEAFYKCKYYKESTGTPRTGATFVAC